MSDLGTSRRLAGGEVFDTVVGGSPAGPGSGLPADDAPVYVISVAAALSGLHPQTLRQYDRLGLVSPGRSTGRGRRYSARDIASLREVARLSQDEGINLAGVKQIIELEHQVDALQRRVAELQQCLLAAHVEGTRREAAARAEHRRDLVPHRPGALVVWRPTTRRSGHP